MKHISYYYNSIYTLVICIHIIRAHTILKSLSGIQPLNWGTWGWIELTLKPNDHKIWLTSVCSLLYFFLIRSHAQQRTIRWWRTFQHRWRKATRESTKEKQRNSRKCFSSSKRVLFKAQYCIELDTSTADRTNTILYNLGRYSFESCASHTASESRNLNYYSIIRAWFIFKGPSFEGVA